MLEVALKLLKEFSNHSYKAYIVGGFVRDHLLGIESNDIDITTDATPKEVKEIFQDSCLPNEDYGSVVVMMKGIRFDITTFRKDIQYVNNRRPVEVQYIHELYPDILRRDFVMKSSLSLRQVPGGTWERKSQARPQDETIPQTLRWLLRLQFLTDS